MPLFSFHHLTDRQLLETIMADLTKLQTAVEQNTAATDQPSIDAAAQQIAVNTANLNAALAAPAA